MNHRKCEDLITQAELQKGTEFMAENSSGTRIVRELYMNALARRFLDGAMIEPGPLTFDQKLKIVCDRKQAASEPLSWVKIKPAI